VKENNIIRVKGAGSLAEFEAEPQGFAYDFRYPQNY
jgi:hypothetical protein